jgi:hypothetical protein
MPKLAGYPRKKLGSKKGSMKSRAKKKMTSTAGRKKSAC